MLIQVLMFFTISSESLPKNLVGGIGQKSLFFMFFYVFTSIYQMGKYFSKFSSKLYKEKWAKILYFLHFLHCIYSIGFREIYYFTVFLFLHNKCVAKNSIFLEKIDNFRSIYYMGFYKLIYIFIILIYQSSIWS